MKSDAAERAAEKAKLWAAHEVAWESFVTDGATRSDPLGYRDIPWPPSTRKLLAGASGGRSAEAGDVRATYRRFMLRWHPDKFAARFSHRLVDADRERVMERVSAISQSVKEQWSGWEEAHAAS